MGFITEAGFTGRTPTIKISTHLMNTRTLRTAFATSALAFGLFFAAESVHSAPVEPGAIDLGTFTPAASGDFVEIDLDQGLLSLASKFTAAHDKDATEVIRGLKRVRVNVVSLDDANRASTLAKVTSVAAQLAGSGWKKIVTAREKSGGDVNVYVKTKGDESIEGLVVTVVENNNQAVFINVVGDIKPEQVNALATRLNIKGLPAINVVAK